MKTKLGERLHTWRKSRRTRQIAGVTVGKPDVAHDTPSHTPGVGQGNAPGRFARNRGIHGRGGSYAWATASRSTGINPLARNSIVPGAPRLTPP